MPSPKRTASTRNPFTYTHPVEPDELIDREAELGELLRLANAGEYSHLEAPRRYGKTSLLRRLADDAEGEGLVPVYVDFSGVVSVSLAVEEVELAYDRLRGAARRTARDLIRTLRPRLRAPGIEVTPRAASEEAPEAWLLRLLDLPADLHRRTSRRALVVFDEFQDLIELAEGIDGLVRGRIQHHGEVASYVFAGSKVSLLRSVFAERERPLYGQAARVTLGPLEDEPLAAYVADRFSAAGREDIEEILDAYLELAAGHPQRAMLLAHRLWEEAARERDMLTAWRRAVSHTMGQLAEAFEATLDSLPRSQRAVLLVLAEGEERPLGERGLARAGLKKTAAQQAINGLVRLGHLDRVGRGRLRFIDPLLREWLRRPPIRRYPVTGELTASQAIEDDRAER